MRVRFDLNGVTLEYERPPMPEHRFRALCLLAAGGLYVGMVCGVAALCGAAGVGVIALATFFIGAVSNA